MPKNKNPMVRTFLDQSIREIDGIIDMTRKTIKILSKYQNMEMLLKIWANIENMFLLISLCYCDI